MRGEFGLGAGVLPQRFEVTRGVRVRGRVISLSAGDDDRLVVEARRPSAVSQPSVQVLVEASVGTESLQRLLFTLEASATLDSVVQWIDWYDFDADRWQRVDTRSATIEDGVVTIAETDSPDRFVDDEGGAVRARISYWDPGVPIAGWSGRIDRTTWRVLR